MTEPASVPEFLKNLGPKTFMWLQNFSSKTLLLLLLQLPQLPFLFVLLLLPNNNNNNLLYNVHSVEEILNQR